MTYLTRMWSNKFIPPSAIYYYVYSVCSSRIADDGLVLVDFEFI